MKKVLILCTGNSCRSIIAEALVNAELEGINAESSGVKASGRVNPNAKKVLEEAGIWRDTYHSKTLDTVIDNDYDLVVTVCGHAQETCPMFPKPVKTIHVGFEDPDGKDYEAFSTSLYNRSTYTSLRTSYEATNDTIYNTDGFNKLEFGNFEYAEVYLKSGYNLFLTVNAEKTWSMLSSQKRDFIQTGTISFHTSIFNALFSSDLRT